MKIRSIWMSTIYATGVAAVLFATIPANAFADDRRNDRRERDDDRRYERRQVEKHDRRENRYENRNEHRREYRDRRYEPPRIIHRGHVYQVPERRVRHYRNVVVVRPYGHWYPGYGYYRADGDAFRWLAFTAITLKILDNLNEQQQREHEAAQIRATTAPIGERITWNSNGVTGSVIATREGTSTSGRYCREFQQQVIVGGRTEQAYGTACRNPDGSWEVVSTENR